MRSFFNEFVTLEFEGFSVMELLLLLLPGAAVVPARTSDRPVSSRRKPRKPLKVSIFAAAAVAAEQTA